MNKSCLACEGGDWHLHVWNATDPIHTSKRVVYQCRSWRHAGACRLWKGSQDFVRTLGALETYSPWTYLVLTFAHGNWPNKWNQYRAGVDLWAKLRKRFSREWGPFRYVQTWERNKGGGAHINVIVNNDVFYQETLKYREKVRNCWLKPHAVGCGFGYITWLEPMKDEQRLAGYLTKLSQELTGAGPKNQIPEDAPAHFRRIRASQKTLPPPKKSGLTGRLVFCTLEEFLMKTPEERITLAKQLLPEVVS